MDALAALAALAGRWGVMGWPGSVTQPKTMRASVCLCVCVCDCRGAWQQDMPRGVATRYAMDAAWKRTARSRGHRHVRRPASCIITKHQRRLPGTKFTCPARCAPSGHALQEHRPAAPALPPVASRVIQTPLASAAGSIANGPKCLARCCSSGKKRCRAGQPPQSPQALQGAA